MGLDMNLYGRKVLSWSNEQFEDNFRISKVTLELAYWRKHSDLHAFIVKFFANGVEHHVIELDREALEKIIIAIENDALLHGSAGTGFFFGSSIQPGEDGYDKQKEYDLKMFRRALEWYNTETSKDWRSVYYRASW